MSLKKVTRSSDADSHSDQITSLFFYDGRLFSSANDGFIKVWSPELKLIKSFQAHPVNVYCAVILNGTIYSCSNDGTVQAWDVNDYSHKKTIFEDPSSEIGKLHASGGRLFGGNDKGVVQAWENDTLIGSYDLLEEVWDLLVIDDTLYTVRNTDVTISTIKSGKGKGSYILKGTLEGHSPIRQLADQICFLSRDAKSIYVHNSSSNNRFEKKAEIKVSDSFMINELREAGDRYLFSGGYDKTINKWDVTTQKNVGSGEIGEAIFAITTLNGPRDLIYVGTDTGRVFKMESV